MGRDTTQQPADGKFMEHWNNARHAASHMAPLTFDTGGGGEGRNIPEATLDAGHFAHIAEHRSRTEDETPGIVEWKAQTDRCTALVSHHLLHPRLISPTLD